MLLVARIILVLVLLAVGTFLGIRMLQEKHAENCLAREMTVKSGISSLSIKDGDMETYLKDLKHLRSEIVEGMGTCPGVGSWSALQNELIPKFRAFAQIWEQEMERMLTEKQYAEAHAALSLLDPHRLPEFGKATELGWSPEALETTRNKYRATMQYMTAAGQLRKLDLSSISTVRASNFEMADAAYREVQSFLDRDLSAVPVRFINSQVELVADCKVFQQRMERMTLDYLDNLQARLAAIARKGSGDISTIDRQINSTVLSTSAILQNSTDVRARQAKLKQHVDALIESLEETAGPEGALNLLNASSPGGQVLAMLSRPEAPDRVKPGSLEPA